MRISMRMSKYKSVYVVLQDFFNQGLGRIVYHTSLAGWKDSSGA
jgi:hypothetical protein